MTNLITISRKENGQSAVDARELHKFLDVKKDFTNWMKYQIKRAYLVEGIDFEVFAKIGETTHKGGYRSKEYALSVSAAKELSMLAGGSKGKQARLYFIECEQQLQQNSLIFNPSEYVPRKEFDKLFDYVVTLEQKVDWFQSADGGITLQHAAHKFHSKGIWHGSEYQLIDLMMYGGILQRQKTKRRTLVAYKRYIDAGYFDWEFLTNGQPKPLLKSEIILTTKGFQWLGDILVSIKEARDNPLIVHSIPRHSSRLLKGGEA